MQAQTLKQWKAAIAAATDPDSPDFTQLADLYRNLMLDSHLASLIDSRILFVQRSAFKLVNDKDEENKELSWLLERPWMDDLIRLVLYSRYQGRTLIEMMELNGQGELAGVEEIPQSHFNPAAGIIQKNPGDSSGWQYKEGEYADNYVQVGKEQDLGMLAQLAPIVLAKKLGMGSWLDYVEKYGVPALFVTTDREDDARLKQLADAARNFKSNHYMVGRGAEKFDISAPSGAGVAPFDQLINRANDELSKRILGGAGITDEKAFVGSAEIQFKLAKDRFESDKLMFKYIFEAEIKPRLLKLSPVYAPLATHYFEWDNTESLNQKEIIEAVSKLGVLYEIDVDYLSAVTGIPITGYKQTAPAAGFQEEKPLGK